ncbi:hypothetical protein McanMca71_002158 [Microsporum canis]|uniref:DUF1740-domain-containing protein n=1 Tax=Arthroderma otae (strain ATCC MYA-4605 / CBS 113480) TaxID=554155 RepID=C5FKX9_ARTOC|nr:conserved hypothetical protein [Microsporum canis CBS 113480]EEQ30351.1 conserved hypothetical protein [Microsporum canis CBS 113480]
MDSDGGRGKASIPKFGSFKPRSTALASDGKGRDEKKSLKEVAGDRERSRRPSSSSRHDESHREREKSRETRSHSGRPRRDQRVDILKPQPALDASDLYVLDPTGDPYTLIYGSLHKYDIPRYYRFGAGRVLGLPTTYTIDQDLSSDTKIVIKLRGATADTIQRSHKALWKSASRPTKLRRLVPRQNEKPDLERDFLPLNEAGSRKRRRMADGFPDTSYIATEEEKLPDYRSIEGKAKPEPDSDVETDMGSDWSLESDGEGARLRHASLFSNAIDNPDDVEGWLQLINHQDNMVGAADREGYRKYTSAEKRSIADMKVSLYEKALKGLSPNVPRDKLLLGMMEEGSLIWDQKTLLNKWKSVLQFNSGYISLWIKYLDVQQTTFTNFTYEKCRQVFLECLKVNENQPDSTEKQIISLYIVLRLSLFMREAGFTEHSIGLWQALLEYNFCCPQGLNSKTDRPAAISAFSEFWESEVPRIGEVGSEGWDKSGEDSPDPKTDPAVPNIDVKDVFSSWGSIEQDLMSSSFLPARTLDEVQEDDPYRVVLFTDISDFLVHLSDPSILHLLIDAFLIFCHLPPISHGDCERTCGWHTDPFLSNRNLDEIGKQLSEWFASISTKEEDVGPCSPFSFPNPIFRNSFDTLFGDGINWFSTFAPWKATYLERSNLVDVEWIRRSLKMLVSRMPDNDYLASYTIALEYSIHPKEAKKYAKSLLKQRPSSIKLYNSYALIEAKNGNIAAAEKVWTTTLSMSQSFSKEAALDCILLWNSWVWEALNNQSAGKATHLLLAIPNNTIDLSSLSKAGDGDAVISATELLKTKRHLDGIQAHGLTFRNSEVFSYATDCLALLLYLTQNQELSGAIEVYDNAEQRLKDQKLDKAVFLEPIHQAKARLLYYHITENRVYKPAQVREELFKSILLFQQNTIFLGLFAFNEARFRVENRVRSVLTRQIHEPADDSTTTKRSTLIPHLFSIYSELHRGVSAGSTAHSVRAAFEAAVSSQSGQHSAALWKLFIQFELTFGESEKARLVFFRSIRACPWSKQLVLLAYGEPRLKESMGFDELRKVFNVLVEKELRVHVDLEEWFEENEEAVVGPDDSAMGQKPPINMPDDRSSDEDEVAVRFIK